MKNKRLFESFSDYYHNKTDESINESTPATNVNEDNKILSELDDYWISKPVDYHKMIDDLNKMNLYSKLKSEYSNELNNYLIDNINGYYIDKKYFNTNGFKLKLPSFIKDNIFIAFDNDKIEGAIFKAKDGHIIAALPVPDVEALLYDFSFVNESFANDYKAGKATFYDVVKTLEDFHGLELELSGNKKLFYFNNEDDDKIKVTVTGTYASVLNTDSGEYINREMNLDEFIEYFISFERDSIEFKNFINGKKFLFTNQGLNLRCNKNKFSFDDLGGNEFKVTINSDKEFEEFVNE